MPTSFHTGLPESGALTLQRCESCGQVNYPPRELCGHCLADALQWQEVEDRGVLQARVELHYSLERCYRLHLPWEVGSVRLDCGPVVLCHLQPGLETGAAVTLRVIEDETGNRMLAALGMDAGSRRAASTWLDHVSFRELTS